MSFKHRTQKITYAAFYRLGVIGNDPKIIHHLERTKEKAMAQLFSWHVDADKLKDQFKSGNYKEMVVTNDSSSDFRVNVNIDGSYYEFVEPGKGRTYPLPKKDDYMISIEKPDGTSGSANGSCSLD